MKSENAKNLTQYELLLLLFDSLIRPSIDRHVELFVYFVSRRLPRTALSVNPVNDSETKILFIDLRKSKSNSLSNATCVYSNPRSDSR